MKTNRFKKKISQIFVSLFGFEANTDITDEIAVQIRKNFVIRNIVTVSNIFYTILFFSISIINPGTAMNWIFTVITFLLTFLVSYMLKKIAEDKKDKTRQEIAMYVSATYIFLSAILVYSRTLSADVNLETSGYLMIFYSLAIISLYQNKKLLINGFFVLLVCITLVHLFLTHDISSYPTLGAFFNDFFGSSDFFDILLRTIIFCIYFIVIFIIVSISQFMQNERRTELNKRRAVQNDFQTIVTDLYKVVFSNAKYLIDTIHAEHIQIMAKKLAVLENLPISSIQEVIEFSVVHLRYIEIKDVFNIEKQTFNEEQFNLIQANATLGSKIAKRIQLASKTVEIIRAQSEGTIDLEFINSYNLIQPDMIAQIVFLTDMYISLRKNLSYKRPMSHKDSINALQNYFSGFFDYNLLEKFLRFNDEFNKIYISFGDAGYIN